MAIDIYLYNTSKRLNSTKVIPYSGATKYSGLLKEGTSVSSPSVLVATPNPGTTYTNYNYAYIPTFGRYYWVRSVVWESPYWRISMDVDSLASFKSAILANNCYVLRSASAYDGDILDGEYPTKGRYELLTSFTQDTWGAGVYIISVMSRNAKFGGSTYWALTEAQYEALMDVLLGDTTSYLGLADPTDPTSTGTITEVSNDMLKCLVNPTQYITSSRWFPLDITSGTATPIYIGWWATGANGTKIINTTARKTFAFTIPRHPDASTYGAFLNHAPYTEYTLIFPPFGTIHLPTQYMQTTGNDTTLRCTVDIDILTGQGVLLLDCPGGRIVMPGKVAAEVPLSYGVRDPASAAISGINAAADTLDAAGSLLSVKKWLSGEAAGSALRSTASAASNIYDAAKAMSPTVQIIGGMETRVAYSTPAVLCANCCVSVDRVNADVGRPLCAQRTLSNLSGYTLIKNADPQITGATSTELEEIIAYMNTGFYIE